MFFRDFWLFKWYDIIHLEFDLGNHINRRNTIRRPSKTLLGTHRQEVIKSRVASASNTLPHGRFLVAPHRG